MVFCPAGDAVKLFLVDPILKVGGCAKLNPPPGADGWGVMEGVADGAGEPAGAPPKENTPGVLLAAPNAPAPPNWNPPPDVELAAVPNTEVAPKAGGWEEAAMKGEGAGEPKAGALGWEETWPKVGAWLLPKPEDDAELNTNGEGPAEGGGAEDEAAGGAAAPKVKEPWAAGAAVLAADPKRKGWAEAGVGAGAGVREGAATGAGWLSWAWLWPNRKVLAGGASLDEPWPNMKVVLGAEAVVLGVPNRLGAGVEEEEEEVVVLLLLAMKPKTGAGAADSEALCPKLKDALGASAGVSLLSAGFPKLKLGWAGSLGGSGLLKENPTDGADEPSASFPAAPKRKPEVPDGSFSSGFPNVNEGAGVSFSADAAAPKVAPPSGAEVMAGLAPGTPPKREVAAVVAVAVVDVLSTENPLSSGFSWEGAGAPKLENEDVVEVVVTAGLASPKEKPPSEGLLSVLLGASAPPNLNPTPAAAGSAFLLSSPAGVVEEDTPNLNPVSLKVASDRAPPNLNPPDEEEEEDETPNLNPPEEAESEEETPNLKPPVAEVESDNEEDVPNLNPAELEFDETPKEEPKALGSTLAPGLAV